MSKKYLKIDDELTLHYEDSGKGPLTLLLIPGWTMSTAVFENQLRFFAESAEVRCLTYDPRAHGKSSKTTDGHHYEQHGRDLQQLIERLDLNHIVLCGWSYGVMDMLAYIDQFGSARLAGVIMLDGPPRGVSEDNQTDWVSYRYDDADGRQEFFTMGRLRDRERTNRAFAEWMLEDPTEANIQWILKITNQTPDTAAALLNATGNFLDYRHVLIELNGKFPLLYVACEELGSVVRAWARENTPAAQVEAFGKHLMFWERAEQFNTMLARFVGVVQAATVSRENQAIPGVFPGEAQRDR